LAATLVLSRAIETSRLGYRLRAVKENEQAAEAMGVDAFRAKMTAYVLSAAPAAVVGAVYIHALLFIVTPDAVFGLLVISQTLVVSLVGGIGTLWGPVIGAAVMVPVSEVLDSTVGDRLPGIQGVVYGAALMLIMIYAPEGLYWRVHQLIRSRAARGAAASRPAIVSAGRDAVVASAPTGGVLLEVRDVSKAFIGLQARAVAVAALAQVGLEDRADDVPGGLTTLELRLMELARCLATAPRLVLLDEPLAGLSSDGVDVMIAMIRRVRGSGVTVVIIEHTMQALLRLADRLIVLDQGRRLAEGAPGEVTRNPAVIEAYLGKRWLARMGTPAC